MRGPSDHRWATLAGVGSFLLPLLVFWFLLLFDIPYSFSRFFHSYSPGLFLVVLASYYLSSRLPRRYGFLAGFGLTMVLVSLTLSYLWSSAFSDNFIISGLLPYKDAKNYFVGATFLNQGIPLAGAGQATERPLFPGFLGVLLLLTGQNLKITLALITQLVGIGLFLSARQIYNSFGPLAAALCSALLYFYIQPLIGYSLSEMLGFVAGCLGFAAIWLAAFRPKWTALIPGLMILMVAVSARAGAFFIFPMMALWAGWVFRGGQRFSLKVSAYVMIVAVAGYVLLNIVYARLLDIPSGSSFGNFSYAIYGQVRGGTGWHSAIEDLGTRNPAIVYRAAWEYFVDHPIGAVIGVAKSYRDFFWVGERGIFSFFRYGLTDWRDVLLWLIMLVLLLRGIVRLGKDISSNRSSLLLAGFAGILLSIPFLPPIDGGSRFYAGTMAFFFALPAVGLAGPQYSESQADGPSPQRWSDRWLPGVVSTVLLILVPVAPLLVYRIAEKPIFAIPECPAGQESFAIEAHEGTYIDLTNDRSLYCSAVPQVCLGDFENHNVERTIDDFYQRLIAMMESENAGARILPAVDLVEVDFHYFYFSRARFPGGLPLGLLTGCASEIQTKNQTIYQVESILSGSQ